MEKSMSCKPGDILVFDGRGCTSRLVRLATCSPHTHVAVAARVRQPDLTRSNGLGQWGLIGDEIINWVDRPLLFESTTLSEAPCVLLKRPFAGVQTHPPGRYVRHYPGRVWCLRLKWSLSEPESRRLTSFLLRAVGTPYDERGAALSATRWLKYGWRNARASDRSTLYCCEVILAALANAFEAGRRYDHVNPGTLTPRGLVRWARKLYEPKWMVKDFGGTR